MLILKETLFKICKNGNQTNNGKFKLTAFQTIVEANFQK